MKQVIKPVIPPGYSTPRRILVMELLVLEYDIEQAYNFCQRNFFDSCWSDDEVLSLAMVAWARQAWPQWYREICSSLTVPDVLLEVVIRDEEGPSEIAHFINSLSIPLRLRALQGIHHDISLCSNPLANRLLYHLDALIAALAAAPQIKKKPQEEELPPWEPQFVRDETLGLFLPKSIVQAIQHAADTSQKSVGQVIEETWLKAGNAIRRFGNAEDAASNFLQERGCKIKLLATLSPDPHRDIAKESSRLDRSPAWIVQLAWQISESVLPEP